MTEQQILDILCQEQKDLIELNERWFEEWKAAFDARR